MRRAQFWEVDKPAVLRRKHALMGKVLPQRGLVRCRVSCPIGLPASLTAAQPDGSIMQQPFRQAPDVAQCSA